MTQTIQKRSHVTPELEKLASGMCGKCGSHMLYHDYDPAGRHNGITCLACGCEQKLPDGSRSVWKNYRGKHAGENDCAN